MRLEDILRRLDELIDKAKGVIATSKQVDLGTFRRQHWGYESRVDEAKFVNFRSSALSFLQSAFDVKHPYYLEFATRVRTNTTDQAQQGLSILEATKEEISGGWLFTVRGLASAEIFSDFLEMASYFLSEGYKDAAAVIVGSTLESHLKRLCQKHGIPISRTDSRGRAAPEKAETLNAELRKAVVYDLNDQKQVTAWLGLRNDAAHGNYSNYKQGQVEVMLKGVQDFIQRNPL